jgi:hypothetical protein
MPSSKHTCFSVHACIHTCMLMCMDNLHAEYIHARMDGCLLTCILSSYLHVCLCTCMYASLPARKQHEWMLTRMPAICMHACMISCMPSYMNVCLITLGNSCLEASNISAETLTCMYRNMFCGLLLACRLTFMFTFLRSISLHFRRFRVVPKYRSRLCSLYNFPVAFFTEVLKLLLHVSLK